LFVVLIGLWLAGDRQRPKTQNPNLIYEDGRITKAKSLESMLKLSLRDPESLKFDVVLIDKYSTVVCAVYRARNGFGGMNKEMIVLAESKADSSPEAWDKYCTKGEMFDMLFAVK
jgi:hypothetical protein